MSIDRTAFNALIDDDGSNLVGSVWDKNAIKTVVLDPIDAAITPAILQTALTGTQDLVVTPQTRYIRCVNTSLLVIRAIAGGADGQVIVIVAFAAQVDVMNGTGATFGVLSGSGVPQLSLADGTANPYHNGRMTIIYDALINRWRVVDHEQGAWLVYPPTWGNTGTANTLGGSSLTGAYRVQGRTCHFRLSHTWGAGTAGGAGAFLYSLPFPGNAAPMPMAAVVLDASAGDIPAIAQAFSATQVALYTAIAINGINPSAPMVWTSGDTVTVNGVYELV